MFRRLLGHYQVASDIYKEKCIKITTLDNQQNTYAQPNIKITTLYNQQSTYAQPNI
jgi:hypothetical protein